MCCKLDYDPVSDIRRVKAMSEKQRAKAVAEVAKYTVKDGDYLTQDDALTDRLCLSWVKPCIVGAFSPWAVSWRRRLSVWPSISRAKTL